MLELAILGLLGEQELHGYEIRKRLRDELGMFANVSFGSLYPALSRLERAGDVESVEDLVVRDRSAAVPMTGSLSGERAALRLNRSPGAIGRRSRKVYRITDKGRKQFAVLLDADPSSEDARGFGRRLAFARYLPPQARLRLLERRRAHLSDKLAESRSTIAAGSSKFDSYTLSLIEHMGETIERDISWLDRLIDSERSRFISETAFGLSNQHPSQTADKPLIPVPQQTPAQSGAAVLGTPSAQSARTGEAT